MPPETPENGDDGNDSITRLSAIGRILVVLGLLFGVMIFGFGYINWSHDHSNQIHCDQQYGEDAEWVGNGWNETSDNLIFCEEGGDYYVTHSPETLTSYMEYLEFIWDTVKNL